MRSSAVSLTAKLSYRLSVRVVHRGRETRRQSVSGVIFGDDSYRFPPYYAVRGGGRHERSPL
jgi:hypothetical protein